MSDKTGGTLVFAIQLAYGPNAYADSIEGYSASSF